MKATEIIKAYMAEKGITYRDMAAKTGKTPQGVWNALNGRNGGTNDRERGGQEPNYITIKKMCDALGLRISIKPQRPTPPDNILEAAEIANVSFSALQRILELGGYMLTIEPPEEST